MGLLNQSQGMPQGMGQEAPQQQQPRGQTITADQVKSEGPPEVSPEAQPSLRRGVEILYGENFEAMIDMVKKNYPENFAKAMSTAVNATIERLRSDGMPQEHTAEVGMALFSMLLEDILSGGTIQELDPAAVQQAIQTTMQDYFQKHPDEYDEQAMSQQMQALDQQEI